MSTLQEVANSSSNDAGPQQVIHQNQRYLSWLKSRVFADMKRKADKTAKLDLHLATAPAGQVPWLELYRQELTRAVVDNKLSLFTKNKYLLYFRQFQEMAPGLDLADVTTFLNQKEHSKSIRNIKLFTLKDFSARFHMHPAVFDIWHVLKYVSCEPDYNPTQALSWAECAALREFLENLKGRLYTFAFDFLLATGVRSNELASLSMDSSSFEFPDNYHAYAIVKQKHKRGTRQNDKRKVPIMDLFLVQEIRRMLNLPYHEFDLSSGYAPWASRIASVKTRIAWAQLSWFPFFYPRKPYPAEALAARKNGFFLPLRLFVT